MKHVFLTSPIYKEMYENVWMWTEFPYNGGRHDYGIDLVAKARNIDEYYAIQCKFYDDEHSVSKSDVDTFLTASGKPFYIKGTPVRYAGRVIVSTTDKWSSTANDIIEGQIPAVSRIRLKDLKEIGIDWDSVSVDNPSSMKQSKKKVVRPHQKTAIVDVLEGFKTADRGKLIMACGTGKTYTALKIVEEITKGDGNVLFLVPSISLLNQTLLEWTKECNYDYQVYAICSDPKVTKSSKETVDNLADTIVPATTNVESLVDGYTNLWNALGKKGIGDYLSRTDKLNTISHFESIKNIPWKYLTPNDNNDWLNQRNPNFMNFIALGDKKKREKVSVYSDNYSSGLSTNRDVWVYNYSGDKAKENAERMISFYNSERERCHQRFNESVIQGICLHVNYERCIDPAEIGLIIDAVKPDYTVSKMKFKKQGKSVCRDTIIYNEYITISNIPERAYEYVINGKSAIEWIVEKYAVTVEKVSGIVDDPNIYQSSKYIFDLLISVIGVSLKTQDLIDRLPEYKEI